MGTLEESDDSVFGNLFFSSYIRYVDVIVTRPQSPFIIKISPFEFCLNYALDINFKLPGINGHASCKFHMVFHSRSNSTCICCCDIGQIDRFSIIELFPLSSCQVIILIARMTFNCSTSCLMS